jgi:cytochrome b subunit of formate dehydrogenase
MKGARVCFWHHNILDESDTDWIHICKEFDEPLSQI